LASWTIKWRDSALKELKKVDKYNQRQITQYLKSRVKTDDDPRRFGKALGGDKAGLWRYRVGDYRIICKIEDEELIVLVVTVGHRRNVYG